KATLARAANVEATECLNMVSLSLFCRAASRCKIGMKIRAYRRQRFGRIARSSFDIARSDRGQKQAKISPARAAMKWRPPVAAAPYSRLCEIGLFPFPYQRADHRAAGNIRVRQRSGGDL